MLGWLGNSYPFVRRVQVVTKTEKTFRGVLWERRGSYLVLREVELLEGRGQARPLDGDVLIDRENVDFMQVIGVAS